MNFEIKQATKKFRECMYMLYSISYTITYKEELPGFFWIIKLAHFVGGLLKTFGAVNLRKSDQDAFSNLQTKIPNFL